MDRRPRRRRRVQRARRQLIRRLPWPCSLSPFPRAPTKFDCSARLTQPLQRGKRRLAWLASRRPRLLRRCAQHEVAGNGHLARRIAQELCRRLPKRNRMDRAQDQGRPPCRSRSELSDHGHAQTPEKQTGRLASEGAEQAHDRRNQRTDRAVVDRAPRKIASTPSHNEKAAAATLRSRQNIQSAGRNAPDRIRRRRRHSARLSVLRACLRALLLYQWVAHKGPPCAYRDRPLSAPARSEASRSALCIQGSPRTVDARFPDFVGPPCARRDHPPSNLV